MLNRALKRESEPSELLMLVGETSFSGYRAGNQILWNVSAPITAWKYSGSSQVYQGRYYLCCELEDEEMHRLQSLVTADSIIWARARVEQNGTTLTLLGDPSPGKDAALEQLQKEQIAPVLWEHPQLGPFTLNRTVDFFEKHLEWQGHSIYVSLVQGDMLQEQGKILSTLWANLTEWEARMAAYAGEHLLELAQDWMEDSWWEEEDEEEDEEEEEREEESLTPQQIQQGLKLSDIHIEECGSFSFFYDSDFFGGHLVHVSGDLISGPTEAGL